MSKSLKRVTKALMDAGLTTAPVEIGPAKTAQQAADSVGCGIDQIAKSILFKGETSGSAILFITAGGNQVCLEKASALAGEELSRATPELVRAQTGFAIGGVAPLGHLTPPRTFLDEFLLGFDTVWAAAGTPQHVFAIAPAALESLSDAQVADFTEPRNG